MVEHIEKTIKNLTILFRKPREVINAQITVKYLAALFTVAEIVESRENQTICDQRCACTNVPWMF